MNVYRQWGKSTAIRVPGPRQNDQQDVAEVEATTAAPQPQLHSHGGQLLWSRAAPVELCPEDLHEISARDVSRVVQVVEGESRLELGDLQAVQRILKARVQRSLRNAFFERHVARRGTTQERRVLQKSLEH